MMLTNDVRPDDAPSGLSAVPVLPWGSHVAHMFASSDDLRATLVPYFKAGLDNNERCLWVTDAPLRAYEARAALREVVPDLDHRERQGQIEIQDGDAFYDADKPLPIHDIVAGLIRRADDAVSTGFVGLRTNGNCAWVDGQRWPEFRGYESLVQEEVPGRRLICMCSYRPDRLGAAEMVDIMERHDLVLRVPEGATRPGVGTAADWQARPRLEAWLEIDQAVLDEFPLGFYCCDADGEILRVNRKAVDLWGRSSHGLDPLQKRQRGVGVATGHPGGSTRHR